MSHNQTMKQSKAGYLALLGLEDAKKQSRVFQSLVVHLHLPVAGGRFRQHDNLFSGELLVVDKVHVPRAGAVRVPRVGSLAQYFGVDWLLALNAAVELLEGVRVGRHELEASLLIILECAFLHSKFNPSD